MRLIGRFLFEEYVSGLARGLHGHYTDELLTSLIFGDGCPDP